MASDVDTAGLSGNRVQVDFTLTTPASKALTVTVEFSEDRGSTYTAASLDSPPGNPGALPSGPDGVRNSVVWQASTDLSNLSQHDLRMRIQPRDSATGALGVAAESPVFGLGDSGAPQVTSLSMPPGTLGGWISITYTVADPDGDHVGLQGEYSLNGGSSYTPASLGRGDGAAAVTAPPGGATHSIAWHAQGDVPDTSDNNVRFRLRALDTTAGAFAASGNFSINTFAPTIDLLTLDEIPRAMNGSQPFTNTASQSESFTLLAPDSGFVVWIEFLAGGSAVDATSLSVTASVALGGGAAAGGVDAGGDFGGGFSVNLAAGTATRTIAPALAFPHGPVTLTAALSDTLGNESLPASFTFEAGQATSDRRPFESPERWYVSFSRDNFAISSSTSGSGTVTITVSAGANGVADFVEDLRILGLQSASPPPSAAGLNAIVLAAVEEAVLEHVHLLYGRNADGSAASASPDIQFSLTPPGGSHSLIAIGGDDPVPGYTIGRAEFDYRNRFLNDDTDSDLGVFTTNLIDFYINTSFSFKVRFDPLIPGRGTALGFHADDATVLDASFDRNDPANSNSENDRYDDLTTSIDSIARVTAVILAHEVGHSVGLVANGAPPGGLFGGEYMAAFAGPYTTAYHLDTSANDVMAASLSFSGAIASGSSAPRFIELIMAYLRERTLLE